MEKYYVVFLVVLLNSCNIKKPKHADLPIIKRATVIKYDGDLYSSPEQIKDSPLNISNLIEDYSYIQLETNDSCLIGKVDCVKLDRSRIYIADYRISKALFVFDLQGRFLFKIQNIGKGPGQYSSLDGFSIDSTSKKIYCYVNSMTLLSFGWNGNFVNEQNLGMRGLSFAQLDSNQFIVEAGFRDNQHLKKYANHNLIVTNKNAEIINGYFKYNLDKIYESLPSSEDPFFRWNGNLYYANKSYSNNIYEIDDEGLKVKYQLDLGSHNIPQNFWLNQNYSESKKIGLEKDYYYLSGFFNLDSYVLLSVTNCARKSLVNYLLYSKINNSVKHTCKFEHKLKENYTFPLGNLSTGFKDKLVFVLSSERFDFDKKELEKSDELGKYMTEKEISFLKKVSPTDNPTLVICNLK